MCALLVVLSTELRNAACVDVVTAHRIELVHRVQPRAALRLLPRLSLSLSLRLSRPSARRPSHRLHILSSPLRLAFPHSVVVLPPFPLSSMGISRSGRYKRRLTGGRKNVHQKKRKAEMGRPSSNTRMGAKRSAERQTAHSNVTQRTASGSDTATSRADSSTACRPRRSRHRCWPLLSVVHRLRLGRSAVYAPPRSRSRSPTYQSAD